MTDTQQKQPPQFNTPTRVIHVTGERVAHMTHLTIDVSRMEQRLVNMSMSGTPASRDAVRRVSERFQQALIAFESETKACSGELEQAQRNSQRRPQKTAVAKPVLSRDKAATQGGAAPASADAKPQRQKQPRKPANQQPQRTTTANTSAKTQSAAGPSISAKSDTKTPAAPAVDAVIEVPAKAKEAQGQRSQPATPLTPVEQVAAPVTAPAAIESL